MNKDKNNIIQSIYYIERLEFLTNSFKSEEDFMLQDELIKDGVVLGIQTICEYANKISLDLKHKYPAIPWRAIADQRNIISHDYGRVDYKSIWKTFKSDIPILKESLDNVLKIEFNVTYFNIKESFK